MPESISWSVNVSSTAGAGVDDSGQLDVPAVLFAKAEVDALANKAFTFQIEQVNKIAALAVKSDVYEDKVSIKGAGAGDVEIKLKGPLFVVGEAVALVSSDLTTITVKNDHATKKATLEILIGLNIA